MDPSGDRPFGFAIVGGGICGLCAASEIHHYCRVDNIKVHVYEQAPQYKEIAAGVGIGVNAAKLSLHLGVDNEMNAIAGSCAGIWMSFRRYDGGWGIVTVPVDDTKIVRQVPVHRADFLDVLLCNVRARGAAMLHTQKGCDKVNVRPQYRTSLAVVKRR